MRGRFMPIIGFRPTSRASGLAKLNRLSRNLAFIAMLMDRKVDFVCCDNPTATKSTIHILAAVAEHDRDAISALTKAALAAAKAKGKQLGNYQRIAAAKQRATVERAEATRPAIAETAHLAACAAAAELNRRSIKTANGKQWHATHHSHARSPRPVIWNGRLSRDGVEGSANGRGYPFCTRMLNFWALLFDLDQYNQKPI